MKVLDELDYPGEWLDVRPHKVLLNVTFPEIVLDGERDRRLVIFVVREWADADRRRAPAPEAAAAAACASVISMPISHSASGTLVCGAYYESF